MGHEGPKSLLSQLIFDNMATGLLSSAGRWLNQSIDYFSINIALTELGETLYEDVIEMVYKFINQIREEGPLEYIYKERKQKR